MNVHPGHIHMVVSFPPRLSVTDFMGILKGKTAIRMIKNYPNLKKKPYWDHYFWSWGYFVNTIEINKDMIWHYIKYQEDEEHKT